MTKRILICDDDADIVDLVSFVLAEAGWETHISYNCNNIFEKIENINPAVILMDNWIPDEGGIKTTQSIKSHPVHKAIPVIYFTANNDINTLAKEAKADFMLAKPFDIASLEQIAEEAYSCYSQAL